MKKVALLWLLLPCFALAHPGIAIVKDSKGAIYYSDLQQVWKISGGKKTIVVPRVHTHELYIDSADNLYGEHVSTISDTQFQHYLWVLRPGGQLDTVVDPQMAYEQLDYSLSRDKWGNEYYIKQFIKRPDTAHIYKKTPDGREMIFAKGNFKGISWLHPQPDGSLLFVQRNTVYRANPDGTVKTVAQNIGSTQPTFALTGNNIIVYGVWQDAAQNVYVAAFSDQAVKKIAPDGTVSTYYTSAPNWAPTQGVFDNDGKLWVLESSDKNEMRVVQAHVAPAEKTDQSMLPLFLTFISALLLVVLGALFLAWKQKRAASNSLYMEQSL